MPELREPVKGDSAPGRRLHRRSLRPWRQPQHRVQPGRDTGDLDLRRVRGECGDEPVTAAPVPLPHPPHMTVVRPGPEEVRERQLIERARRPLALALHREHDARRAGESEDRLHLVAVWREARHFYTPREQAALALTEAVPLVADAGVPDDVYTEAAAHFDERELAQVLSLILAINTWNRVALATRKVAGTDER